MTGPSYTENAIGDVGTGTIIVNAPAGFVFDTGGTAPTVLHHSAGSSARWQQHQRRFQRNGRGDDFGHHARN